MEPRHWLLTHADDLRNYTPGSREPLIGRLTKNIRWLSSSSGSATNRLTRRIRTGRYWHGERKREQERRSDWGKGGAVSRLEAKREMSSGMLPKLGRGSERILDVPGRESDVTTHNTTHNT